MLGQRISPSLTGQCDCTCTSLQGVTAHSPARARRAVTACARALHRARAIDCTGINGSDYSNLRSYHLRWPIAHFLLAFSLPLILILALLVSCIAF